MIRNPVGVSPDNRLKHDVFIWSCSNHVICSNRFTSRSCPCWRTAGDTTRPAKIAGIQANNYGRSFCARVAVNTRRTDCRGLLAVIFVGFPDNNMLIVVVRRKHEQADVKFHWLPRLCVNLKASIRVQQKTLKRHWYSLRAKAFRSRRIISEKRHYEPRARELVCNESSGRPSVTRTAHCRIRKEHL
jgi:hypothetical protein